MTNVFEYQNYRTYLHDFYQEQKGKHKRFSYRTFSQKAGIKTSSFLYHVIEGKKNLTKNSIVKISNAIGHTREESDYFENLVFFNQANSINEKTHYYTRLIEIQRPVDVVNVNKDQYEYYCNWYHSVIREVVTLIDFADDFKKLGSFLVPQISAKEAKDSIKLLERLGFIERDEDGLYHQTANLIQAKPDLSDFYVAQRFQLEMLKVAMKSYDTSTLQERMSSSTTFSISKKTFDLFKLRTREFRRELMEMARLDDEQDRTYQMTINLFPVSRSAHHEK